MKTLIVEDDPNLTALWQTVLAGKGHEAQVCLTTESALSELSEGSFDLLILDLSVSDRTGVTLLNALEDHGSGPSALVVTGSADYCNGELFEMTSSVRAVMRKPVNIEDMLDVAEHLGVSGAALPPHRLENLPIEMPN